MNVPDLIALARQKNACVLALPVHSGVKVIVHDNNRDFSYGDDLSMLVTEATIKAAGPNLETVVEHGVKRIFDTLDRMRTEKHPTI